MEDVLEMCWLIEEHPLSMREVAASLGISPSRLSHRLADLREGRFPPWKRKGAVYNLVAACNRDVSPQLWEATNRLRKLVRWGTISGAPGRGIPSSRHVRARGGA